MTQVRAPGLGWASLAEADPELWDAMLHEKRRQGKSGAAFYLWLRKTHEDRNPAG